MSLKDYYAILGLPPSASLPEIKKAYRKLAHQFHPDKNLEEVDRQQFAEIKEAYEVLIDPGKKQEYLQQRWYQQSLGRKKFQKAFTPFNLLQQVLELERHAAKLDANRIDREGLSAYIMEIITDENIEKLNAASDEHINKQVILSLLNATHHLSLNQLHQVGGQLQKIKPLEFSRSKLQHVKIQKQKAHTWDRSRLWLVVILVVLIVLVILFAAT